MSGGITRNGSDNIFIERNNKIYPYSYNFGLLPGDIINVKSNFKYKILGDMSLLQSLAALTTLYLSFIAATN